LDFFIFPTQEQRRAAAEWSPSVQEDGDFVDGCGRNLSHACATAAAQASTPKRPHGKKQHNKTAPAAITQSIITGAPHRKLKHEARVESREFTEP